MQIKNDVQTLIKTRGKYQAKKIGINEASTFTGFCATHDNSLFAPLESSAYTGTREQNFLMFFRAWSHELHSKEGARRTISNMRDADRGRSVAQQRSMQSFLDGYEDSVKLGLRDLKVFKELLDHAWDSRSFDIIESCVVEFQSKLPFVCSGATYPYFSTTGVNLQQYSVDAAPAPLSITLLIEEARTIAVLSWLKEYAAAPSRFVSELLGEPIVSDALCRVIYSCIENVYANPEWWNGLAPAQRDELVARMKDSATLRDAADPTFLVARGSPFCDVEVALTRRV